MTYRIIVRQPAEHDLIEAQRWYEERRAGLGADFRTTVAALLDQLGLRPQIYPVVHRETRRAVLRRFPYLVYFVINGNEVVILGCLHTSLDPRQHRERLL